MATAPEVGLDAIRRNLVDATTAFPHAVEKLRRSLFRLHLMANLSTASPLLAVVAETDGVDFERAALAIRPPLGWPERPLRPASNLFRHGAERRFAFTFDQILRRHRRAGRIVGASAVSNNVMGVRVVGDCLELTAIDGGLRIETARGLARIVVDGALPSVITVACKGRPVDTLISHRWLDGRGWPIVAFDDIDGERTAIYIGTGLATWGLPYDPALAFAPGSGAVS